MLMAAPSGEAVAVKVIDGGYRAATLIALELLAQGGVIDACGGRPGRDAHHAPVTGGDEVGRPHPPGVLALRTWRGACDGPPS